MKATKPKKPQVVTEFVLEVGVEIPPRSRRVKYPFARMAVGASFVAPLRMRSSLGGYNRKRRKEGKVFETRNLGDGNVRIWRTT